MATMDEVAIGDVVELTEPADLAPAGAQGGITDLLDDGKVIVEVTTLPREPILERIVVVPPETLRIVGRAQPRA
jgi:hypothetical protein